MINGSIPQLIRFERYLFVAYSLAMLAHPPRTFWHDAACSLAEPSPGLTAKIVEPKPVFVWFASANFVFTTVITGFTSSLTSQGCPPSIRIFSHFAISLATPTYAGSFLESVNSASPNGLDLNDEVSPDGISSSVVVTGS